MTAATALHEAGHLWAGLVLLGTVAPVVTIKRAPGYLGACIGMPGAPRQYLDPSRPWATDPAIRAAAEAHITMLLAGRAAEALTWTRGEGWAVDDDTEPACRKRAETEARSLERLSPRDAELLREAEAAPYLVSDLSAAGAIAERIAVGEAGAYLVMYLERVASMFVHRHAAALFQIAEAIRAHGTLRGSEALAYVTERAEVTHAEPAA